MGTFWFIIVFILVIFFYGYCNTVLRKNININNKKTTINTKYWKPAQENNLPEIDREVIVLVEEYGHYKVCFAHRPVESYTGISITNHSEMEEYYPERYDKGGWNIPDVKYWLDLNIPKL